jgi:hypothetical protein
MPPQTIILSPVHTAVWSERAGGASTMEVSVHTSVTGSYRPPVSRPAEILVPPQTIISVPVQTAV